MTKKNKKIRVKDYFAGLENEITINYPGRNVSPIWFREIEDRRIILADKINEVFGLKAASTKEEYVKKLIQLIKTDDDKLDINEKNIKNYVKGQSNLKQFVNGSYKRIVKELREEIKETKISQQKYVKIRGEKYQRSRKEVYGYVKGVKVKGYIEKRLVRGVFSYKIRTKKGTYASFIG